MSVLAWHEIADRPTSTAVTPRRFAAQIDLLTDMGLPILSLDESLGRARGGVALTFDDGHLETYTQAYPLLARRGLTATVYVVTGPVSTGGWFEPGGRPMNWSMIRELHAAGWTIGSHTVHHPRLTQVADEILRQELAGSRETLEDALGSPCRHFCAPHGAMDQRVLDAVRDAGYRSAALSLPARFRYSDPGGVVPRSGVYPGTSWWRFRIKARGWDLFLRGGRELKKAGMAMARTD
jgi:peptidoglycan/xylan/chitin deacetylase (PgdA/CDA1 family)